MMISWKSSKSILLLDGIGVRETVEVTERLIRQNLVEEGDR